VRKRILRDAFATDLPPGILDRRKMGFLMPIRAWFRAGPLRDHLEARVAAQSRFDPATVGRFLAEHASGQSDHSVLLWSLLVFLSWRDKRAALAARAA
jgi:asparagine synthase (glutamine-hydrolysing)